MNTVRTATSVAAAAMTDYDAKGFDVLVALPIFNPEQGHGAILAVVDADNTAYAVEVFGDDRPREFHAADSGVDAWAIAVDLAGWS